jgi:glucosamine--fructose-6-phosphate aminotransferase (isomerizing)
MSLMLDEIHQQPAAIERTIKRESKKIESFAARVDAARPRLIVLVARGSSDNAALFGRYLIEMTTGIPVSLAAPAIHTLYKTKMDMRGALVIGISQSGEGVDINMTLENASRCGATTLAITNEADSAMARLADETFLIHAGRERSVAATKTYTGQLLIFHLLASALSRNGHKAEIERLPELAAASLTLQSRISEIVERYTFMEQCVVVGRSLNYANAFEFAIKLMETCYVVAERFSGADFLHGPIAMVDQGFPVFVFASPGPTLSGTKDLLATLQRLGAETIVVSSEPGALKSAVQAEAKGLSPDQPRSLSKVTKTV